MRSKLGCWERAEAGVGYITEHGGNMLLSGPPGTGKSWLARHYKSDPTKTFVITFNEETPYTVLEGGIQVVNGPKGPVTRWVQGIATAAWTLGGRLVLEEIDRASTECRSILHSILDNIETAFITVDDPDDPTKKITIRPAPGFHCIATTNADNVDDGECLHSALRDRLWAHVRIDEIAPGALACLPEYLREGANRLVVSEDAARRTSVRALLGFHKMTEAGTSIEMAAALVWGERASDMVDALKISVAAVTDANVVNKGDKAPKAEEKGIEVKVPEGAPVASSSSSSSSSSDDDDDWGEDGNW